MGLAFDLAEAINLGWGVASGEGAASIRDSLRDRSFRAAVIEDFEHASLSRTSPSALKVAKHPAFLEWLGDGGESNLADHLTDEQLKSLGIRNSDEALRVGELLRESVRSTVVRFASWPERQLLADAGQLQASLGMVRELLSASLLQETSRAFATHGRYVTRLRRRRGGQTSDAQPYVAPAPHHPAHPDNLWSRLSTGDGESILVRGVGGSGKTRLLLEVADRANDLGWHVIHVLERPSSSVAELSAAVLTSDRPVLVVLDYPNELDGIELADIDEELLPEAQAAGVQLALLAAARPGWIATAPPLGPFSVVDIDTTDAYQRNVAYSVGLSIAPTAARQIGETEFGRVIGDRPMIATLIARELERRAQASALPPNLTTTIRSGHLTDWFRRRLDEDGYAIDRPARVAEQRVLAAPLCVAAALAVVTPAARPVVISHGTTTALAVGAPEPDRFAERTLRQLLQLGWLSTSEGQVSAIHDTVVDHLITEVVDSDLHNGTGAIGAAVFGATLTAPEALVSLLGNLRRYVTDPDGTAGLPTAARIDYVLTWVDEVAPRICTVVLGTSDGTTAASLLKLLQGRPWQRATQELAQDCAKEWLADHGAEPAAAPMVLHVLKRGRADGMDWSLAAARSWLTEHGTDTSALGLLSTLLVRGRPPKTDWVLDAVRTWLDVHGSEAIAATLLVRLAARPGWARRTWVGEAMQTWLNVHGTEPAAAPLLTRLLERPELARDSWILDAVRAWLTVHGTESAAAPTLTRLIERRGSNRDEWVISAVRTWLELHGTKRKAVPVLGRLMGRREFVAYEWALDAVRAWLAIHGTEPAAVSVLSGFAERRELIRRKWALDAIRSWLTIHGTDPSAFIILTKLMERPQSGRDEWVLNAVKGWLAVYGTEPAGALMLINLVERRDGALNEWQLDAVRAWLTAHGTEHGAVALLTKLIEQSQGASDPWILDAVQAWLTAHGTEHGAVALLTKLIEQSLGASDPWVLDAVQAWLTEFGTEPSALAMLAGLVARFDRPRDEWVLDAAKAWLATNGTELSAGELLKQLLGKCELEYDRWVLPATRRWLAVNGDDPIARRVLTWVLGQADLNHNKWVLAAARRWIAVNGNKPIARPVLTWLLGQADLNQNKWVLFECQRWIAINGKGPAAAPLLTWLLGQADLDKNPWILDTSRRWLTSNGTVLAASTLLTWLLSRADLDKNPWILDDVQSWLTTHHDEPSASALRDALVAARRT